MKIDVISVALISFTAAIVISKNRKRVDRLVEDGRLTFLELANKYGFPAQEETVTTQDGYALTLFHIPGYSSRPVLLVHGNTPTADCWIIRGSGSLAITLAKRGYDVWAINLRGSRYSRKHVYFDPDKQQEQFFNYTFYEQGIYDLPVTIDFILHKTKQKDLIAIGHSVGTTLLYVLGAERPEYNDKIRLAVSLSPISFLQNVQGLVRWLIATGPTLIKLTRKLKIYEIFDHKKFRPLFETLCLTPFGYDLCIKFGISSILGSDTNNFEPEFQPIFFGHFPGGTSVKLLTHLIQVSLKNRFAKFDYGATRNLRIYGSLEPTKFNLTKVRMKSALFVGKEDFLGTVADAELLKRALPNVVYYQVLPDGNFNHADFVWGRHMTVTLFPYLLGLMEKYT